MRLDTLAVEQSLTQARKIQDELAAQGGWVVVRRNEWGVIYGHSPADNEEIYIEKEGIRRWLVVKSIKEVEKV